MKIGIDVGGTNIVVALVDDKGNICNKASQPAERGSTAEELCTQILHLACRAASDCGMVTSVGIGIPGLVDSQEGVILKTPNLPFKNTPIRELFQKEWDIPVYLGNDANCAAIGECHAGAAKGAESVLMVTLGTGIGGGFMYKGKLFEGRYHGAMEIGHMVIEKGGRLCGCGKRGCFERYASATALIRTAGEWLPNAKTSVLWGLCNGDPAKLTGAMVFQGAKLRDSVAISAVENYTTYLAIGLSNLINVLQPEVICLGGGISHAPGELLLDPLCEKLKRYVFDDSAPLRIEKAALGNDAGLIGAALICEAL